MIWHGFPVLRYLFLAGLLLAALMWSICRSISLSGHGILHCRASRSKTPSPQLYRCFHCLSQCAAASAAARSPGAMQFIVSRRLPITWHRTVCGCSSAARDVLHGEPARALADADVSGDETVARTSELLQTTDENARCRAFVLAVVVDVVVIIMESSTARYVVPAGWRRSHQFRIYSLARQACCSIAVSPAAPIRIRRMLPCWEGCPTCRANEVLYGRSSAGLPKTAGTAASAQATRLQHQLSLQRRFRLGEHGGVFQAAAGSTASSVAMTSIGAISIPPGRLQPGAVRAGQRGAAERASRSSPPF